MTILLILALIAVPTLIGTGASIIYLKIKSLITGKKAPQVNSSKYRNKSAICRFCTIFSCGALITLLSAGIVNALSVFLHLSVSRGGLILFLILGAASVISAILVVFYCVHRKKNDVSADAGRSGYKHDASQSISGNSSSAGKPIVALLITAAVIAVIQLFFVGYQTDITMLGDQTPETVNSFLSTDRIYAVDPLTGNPYLNGYPFRLSLQCLPFLYSVIAGSFSVSSTLVVWHIMPAFWLFCGYCCFIRIADALFEKNTSKIIFFIICEFLLWCSDAALGGTGFGIFHLGFSSVVVLALLLVNWTIGSVLSHNSVAAIPAIIAEPLVASTQYGLGACFLITAALIIISRLPITKRLVRSLAPDDSSSTTSVQSEVPTTSPDAVQLKGGNNGNN